jgi:hypothetical protein
LRSTPWTTGPAVLGPLFEFLGDLLRMHTIREASARYGTPGRASVNWARRGGRVAGEKQKAIR